MEYMRIDWNHDFDDEPVTMFLEIDNNQFERRRLEIFRDGSTGLAESVEDHGRTQLGWLEVPPAEEISAEAGFSAKIISKTDFENVWRAANSG